MRLKDLFTVPTGQKVTEKHLRRVLISSICSILLCMSFLASTTWAWFAVGIENTGNMIQIGKPEVNLTTNGTAIESGTKLPVGTHKISIEHTNQLDDLQKKSSLYVTLTIDGTTTVYTTLSYENGYKAEFTIIAGTECILSWDVSWFAPANATELTDDTITLTAEDSTESTAEPANGSNAVPTGSASNETTDPATEITEPVTTESADDAS